MSSAKGDRLTGGAEDPLGVVSSARQELELETYRRGAVQDASGGCIHFRFAGVTLDTWSRLRDRVRVAVAMARLVIEEVMRRKPPGTFLKWNRKCASGVKTLP